MEGSGVQLDVATNLMERAKGFTVKTEDVTSGCKELNAVFSWLKKVHGRAVLLSYLG